MKIQKQIEVRLARKGNDSLIRVVQYDTGVQLVFNMMDFEVPSGTTATLYVRKKSGKFVYQEKGITVTATAVTVDLENQALTEHGKAFCQLRLVNGTDTISTFASTMIVEPSYRDADAVESKTVIAAFEKKTAEQIAEIEAAANEQIERIQNLYSTYATKNEAANAIKGNLTGAVVFADDVSPVEHSPVVKVHGKNLIPYGTITFTRNQSCLLDNPLPAGTYTISAHIESSDTDSVYSAVSINSKSEVMKYLALKRGNRVSSTFTVDKPITNIDFCSAYNYSQGEGDTATWSDIQLEEGSVSTDYEPYIDPSTVTVSRCGKNLQKNDATTQTINGVTFTVNDDGSVTASGTATENARFVIYKRVPLKAGVKCVLNGNPSGASETTYFLHTVMAWGGVDHSFYDYGNGCEIEVGGTVTASTVSIHIKSGVTVNGLTFRPMIRLDSVTDATFEPYNGAEYTPEADGTVPDMTSLSPNMTILTDTEGAIVECEYIRDTKCLETMTVTVTDGATSHTPPEIYAHVKRGGTAVLFEGGFYAHIEECTAERVTFARFDDGVSCSHYLSTGMLKYYKIERNFRDKIDTPTTAKVGQTVVVKSVDSSGKPTTWETVDYQPTFTSPSGKKFKLTVDDAGTVSATEV